MTTNPVLDPIDIQRAAPLPYNTVEVGEHTASAGCHIYITDKNGRKIAAIWGKADEKAFTAALLVAAINFLGATGEPTT